jgi:hypothetical protein
MLNMKFIYIYEEMKFLRENQYRVITFADIGYDQQGNKLFIKTGS